MINVGKVKEGEQINALCYSHDKLIGYFVLNENIRVTIILVKTTNGLIRSRKYIHYNTACQDLSDMYTPSGSLHYIIKEWVIQVLKYQC